MSMPIEVIIVLIIALVVLILVLLFITGKWASLTQTFSGLEAQVAESANQSII